MLAKSAVIVLGSVKYGDSSIILKTYSEKFGLLSFIAGGVRGKKGSLRSSMVQVLSQLELVFYQNSKSDLKRIKEASVPRAYQNVLFDPFKNCISMFLAEALSHFIKEEEVNKPLYHYLSHSLYWLDESEEGKANFHLVFLYDLSGYLGFKIQPPVEKAYFDLLDGSYTSHDPPHGHVLKDDVLKYWKLLGKTGMGNLPELKLNGDIRFKLLEALLTYYRLHLRDFGELKSLDVLHTVMR